MHAKSIPTATPARAYFSAILLSSVIGWSPHPILQPWSHFYSSLSTQAPVFSPDFFILLKFNNTLIVVSGLGVISSLLKRSTAESSSKEICRYHLSRDFWSSTPSGLPIPGHLSQKAADTRQTTTLDFSLQPPNQRRVIGSDANSFIEQVVISPIWLSHPVLQAQSSHRYSPG